MRRLTTHGLLACALVFCVTACTEPKSTEPLASLAASRPLSTVSVDPLTTDYLTFGGTGGDTYYDNCPANSVAIGTSGTMVRYNGTAAMYLLRLRCRVLNADGTFGATVTTVGGRGRGLGVDAWAPFVADCPSGSMLVAANGLADGIIRAYGVTCRSFDGARSALGPWTGIGTMPPSAVAYAGECAPGRAITGLISHAGYILDGMSFRCTAISGAAPTATFAAPPTVAEGSSFALAMTAPEAAGNVLALTYAFDCGTGYGAPGAATTATCTTSDDAVRTVHGRVATVDGVATEYTALVTVTNVAPVIGALPSDSLLTGETYTATGTFTDPGADSWIMVVSYGPLFNPPVALASRTFSLSKTYSTAGTFPFTVKVRDDDGGIGSQTATVVVSTPAQGATFLGKRISQLAASGDIPPQSAAPMQATLSAAAKQLADGKTIPAQNQLNAFKHQVDAAVTSKKIVESVATPLKGAANRIIASSKK